MKKYAFILLLALGACSSNDNGDNNNDNDRDYRQDMRDFVIGISQTAKAVNPNFAIIPQNGIELVTNDGEANGTPNSAYLSAIDGNGQEDLLYGYDNDNAPTPVSVTNHLKGLLDVSKSAGNTILVTDYCSSPAKINDSYQQNAASGYISYCAIERALNIIPAEIPHNVNDGDISSLSEAKNFIFLINPENYSTKAAFINAITATNYDAVIIDLFLEDEAFTATEIAQMRQKANGGTRLIICYMSVGEAEDYRYYWKDSWNSSRPSWIAAENPDWPGNYKVKYWNDDWQGLIYKNDDSYLSMILEAGFDGVYLDIIDAFEYFE